jgi:hypothetical protein
MWSYLAMWNPKHYACDDKHAQVLFCALKDHSDEDEECACIDGGFASPL